MIPYKLVQPYKKYFQKSKSFLYPALGIRRGNYITPEQTYISWHAKVRPADKTLIVLYEQTGTEAYARFEKNILLKHPMFSGFFMCENNRCVYTFSFDGLEEDWNNFLMGKYSKLSIMLKEKIRTYFGPSSNEYAYVDSFLYPQKYFDTYVDLLGVDRSVLEEMGELTDPYDPVKENLLAVPTSRYKSHSNR